MTQNFPLHDDDIKVLMDIRRYLIGFRKTNGWSQPVLSQMINLTDGTAYNLESDDKWQWHLSRLQNWTTPFRLRLDAKLCFDVGDGADQDLEDRIHAHPMVAPMFSLSRASGDWKKWQRVYITTALQTAREELEVSVEIMAKYMGLNPRAIVAMEAMTSDVVLPKALHYARKLGGRISLSLQPEEFGEQ
jgi:DNA-binding XRE family transcriptional regulator